MKLGGGDCDACASGGCAAGAGEARLDNGVDFSISLGRDADGNSAGEFWHRQPQINQFGATPCATNVHIPSANPCVEVRGDLIRRQVSRIAAVQQRAAQTALDTVAGSVALAILQMAEQEHATDLRVTHEELAQRLGTVRESVSLAVNKLRRAGALAPSGGRKRLISILSLPKLQQLAGARPVAR